MYEENWKHLELSGVELTGDELGRGAYGYVIGLRVKGLRCAGKCLHDTFFDGSSLKEKHRITSIFLKECVQHSKLHHPNIVQCLGVYTASDSDVPMLVMEYMPLSLSRCLEKYTCIPLSLKYRILLGVSAGLCFLHDQDPPIVHRDLTSNNILLSESLQAKIADFGVSRIISADARMASLTTAPGTTVYMPPEALVAHPRYDKQLDIFSFGVLIIHVVVQVLPAPNIAATRVDENDRSKVVGVSEVERQAVFLDQMKNEDVLNSLAKSCLSNDPQQRPSISHIISELEDLVSKNSYQFSFSNMLEAAQQLEQSKAVESTLKNQAQCLHSQLTTIVEDVRKKGNVMLSSFSSQIECSSRIASDMMRGESADNKSRLVVNIPSDHIKKCFIRLSSVQPSPECSLILQPPLNISFSGKYVKTVASNFAKAWGVAVNKAGTVFVVDNKGWDSVCSYDSSGKCSVLVRSAGTWEFNAPDLSCWLPTAVAVVSNDLLIVADSGNKRLLKLKLSQQPSDEVVVVAKSEKGLFRNISSFSSIVPSSQRSMISPVGIAISKENSIFVCDRENHCLLILDSNLALLRTFGSEGTGPDQFVHPWDVAFDSYSNLYVSDCSNSCIKVFSSDFRPLHIISGPGSGLDNLRGPAGICIDLNDYLYVADKDRRRVYVFDSSGKFKMYFSGSPNGQFTKPLGVAVDCNGCVYVSDGEGRKVEMFV